MTSQQQDNSTEYSGRLAPPPASSLPLAILAIVTFVPFGIVALLRALSVRGLWEQGEYDSSVRAAADARRWSIRALAVGVSIAVLSVGAALVLSRS
ncbi:CD225/dispanin family protein [Rhodococcus marinonascens]|uniref:CD225/dispanin family protein n=1 Tax=Rhodococcus marinonascens TaxID=38311 RepID=UPI00093328DA|nr:CD225/dispanin family protein [Rhodococcus marinonascens]